jgi:copper chaperone CopZ
MLRNAHHWTKHIARIGRLEMRGIVRNRRGFGVPKLFTIVLTGLAVLGLGYGCGGSSKKLTITEEAGTEIRVYEIFGMDCPGCHGGLEKLVNKLPGVMTCQANWKDQRLTIKLRLGTQLSDEEISVAIKQANFTPGKRLK